MKHREPWFAGQRLRHAEKRVSSRARFGLENKCPTRGRGAFPPDEAQPLNAQRHGKVVDQLQVGLVHGSVQPTRALPHPVQVTDLVLNQEGPDVHLAIISLPIQRLLVRPGHG